MLIQSKFRDYYDNCIGFGIDKTVVYKRETSSKNLPPQYHKKYVPEEEAVRAACDGWGPDITPCLYQDSDPRRQRRQGLAIGVIGVAGTLYKFCRRDYWDEGEIVHMFYTADSMDDELKKKKIRLFGEGTYGDAFGAPLVRDNTNIFLRLGVPAFVAYRDHLILNPCLKDYDFGKIKDGTSAFQEISGFIAGTLNTANALPMVTDDKSLAYSKGFDDKSFRKEPTKHGKRR